MKTKTYFLLAILIMLLSACQKDVVFKEDKLTAEDHLKVGATIYNYMISNENDESPILRKSDHPEVYEYLESRLEKIIDASPFPLKSDVQWNVIVLDNDDKTTYFATPKGDIYIYSGLLKRLGTESQIMYILTQGLGLVHTDIAINRLLANYSTTELRFMVDKNDFALASQMPTTLSEKYSFQQLEELDHFIKFLLCPSDIKVTDYEFFFWPLETDFFNSYIGVKHYSFWKEVVKSGECLGAVDDREGYATFKSLLP